MEITTKFVHDPLLQQPLLSIAQPNVTATKSKKGILLSRTTVTYFCHTHNFRGDSIYVENLNALSANEKEHVLQKYWNCPRNFRLSITQNGIETSGQLLYPIIA